MRRQFYFRRHRPFGGAVRRAASLAVANPTDTRSNDGTHQLEIFDGVSYLFQTLVETFPSLSKPFLHLQNGAEIEMRLRCARRNCQNSTVYILSLSETTGLEMLSRYLDGLLDGQIHARTFSVSNVEKRTALAEALESCQRAEADMAVN